VEGTPGALVRREIGSRSSRRGAVGREFGLHSTNHPRVKVRPCSGHHPLKSSLHSPPRTRKPQPYRVCLNRRFDLSPASKVAFTRANLESTVNLIEVSWHILQKVSHWNWACSSPSVVLQGEVKNSLCCNNELGIGASRRATGIFRATPHCCSWIGPGTLPILGEVRCQKPEYHCDDNTAQGSYNCPHTHETCTTTPLMRR
jgi:hypothetical protein